MDYYFGLLEKAIFIKRENRFRAEIQLDGKVYKAHVPNSGRMAELLVPGASVWVRKTQNNLRKTPYDLLLVEKDGIMVCLNAHLANDLFAVWLKNGKIPFFRSCTTFYREKTIGQSRIDFLLEFPRYHYLVEVKSVNLVENKTALFPDAPTARGVRHLEELISFCNDNHKAAVAFVVMREDAQEFAPHDQMDPIFGRTLRKASNCGVKILAYKCSVTEKGMEYLEKLPVIL